MRGWLALAAMTVFASSCGDCISIGFIAATVRARDATTGTVVAFTNASITVTGPRGPASTTLNSVDNEFVICCQSGRLTIELRVPGYTATTSTIDVEGDGCGVAKHAETIELRLQPSPLREAPDD